MLNSCYAKKTLPDGRVWVVWAEEISADKYCAEYSWYSLAVWSESEALAQMANLGEDAITDTRTGAGGLGWALWALNHIMNQEVSDSSEERYDYIVGFEPQRLKAYANLLQRRGWEIEGDGSACLTRQGGNLHFG